MPIIVNPEDTRLHRQGAGWAATILADEQTIGTPAMVARRWSLQPSARSPVNIHGKVEQLIYIITGEGKAYVNNTIYPLGPETVVWLEPGDQYQFEAGEKSLEILQGYAPGEAK